MQKICILFVLVMFSFSSVALYGESGQRNLLDKLLYSRDSSFGGLGDISSNREFFSHEIDRDNLNAIKKVIGENLFVSMRLNFEEGKSVSEFIEANKAVLRNNPYVMSALVHNLTSEKDIALSAPSSGGDVVDVDMPEPARTISAKDLYQYGQGPDASPRNFREFLARNYGLSNKPPVDRPDQIDAFSVFFNYAGSVKDGNLPEDADPAELLTDRFVRDSGRGDVAEPDSDAKGLFLPSNETLDKMTALLTMYKELEYAQSNGHSPDLSSVDRDVVDEFLEASGVTNVSDLSGLSIDSIQEYMSGLVENTVRNELDQNDYVAEVSSVAVGSEDNSGGANNSSNTGNVVNSSSFVNPTFVVGSDQATSEMNLIYSDAMAPMTEAQRTRLEMENGGLFHLNGNPDDVQDGGKLYHFLGTPDISDGFLSLMERPRDTPDK